MKTINKLVVQSDMPNNNNVIWLCGNTAKYYNNGTWTTLGESYTIVCDGFTSNVEYINIKEPTADYAISLKSVVSSFL